MQVSINTSAVPKQIAKATTDLGLLLEAEFTKAITDNSWEWPRGESPRDIVDTGALRQSQQQLKPVYENGQVTLTYLWAAPYSAAVHNGVRYRNGTESPPREWTKKALDNYPIADVYRRLLV